MSMSYLNPEVDKKLGTTAVDVYAIVEREQEKTKLICKQTDSDVCYVS